MSNVKCYIFAATPYLTNIYIRTPDRDFLGKQIFEYGLLVLTNTSLFQPRNFIFCKALLPECVYRVWDHFSYLLKE